MPLEDCPRHPACALGCPPSASLADVLGIGYDSAMRPVPDVVSERLMAACLVCPEAHAALGRLCDEWGGRPAGSPASAAAEEWAAGLLGGWGLVDLRFEALEIQYWERGPLEATVLSPARWTLLAMAHGFCPETVNLEAELLDLGHGESEDYAAAGQAVRGRLALVDEPVRPGHRALHRSEKLRLAIQHGAAGLLSLSSADGGLPRTGTCHRGLSPIPSLGISREDGLRLRRMLAAGSADDRLPRLAIRMQNQSGMATTRNVLADLTGREMPDELVLAGAHLDSWDVAQGATDNGLGSAIVLDMARALASLPPEYRPRRSLRFALWAAEEIGLLGSTHYVDSHRDALPQHRAVLNFDMTGDPYGFWLPGRSDASGMLAALDRQLAPLGMRGEMRHEAGLHSDHQPFMLAGVPVMSLLGELGAQGGRYYHSVGDTFEKVRLPAQCRAACVGAHLMWALADAEAPDCLPHLDAAGVKSMVDAAGLGEALEAAGYGPVDVSRLPSG